MSEATLGLILGPIFGSTQEMKSGHLGESPEPLPGISLSMGFPLKPKFRGETLGADGVE